MCLPKEVVNAHGLVAGQLGYDRSEHVCEVGAEDEIGEADLLPSPLDLLCGRRPRAVPGSWAPVRHQDRFEQFPEFVDRKLSLAQDRRKRAATGANDSPARLSASPRAYRFQSDSASLTAAAS